MTGAELRSWRLSRGMLARHLAGWLDVTPEHLSRMERGHQPISTVTRLALDGIDVARMRLAARGEPMR